MIRLEPHDWNDEAGAELAPALGADIEIVREQVQTGDARLYRVQGYGWIVLRVERAGTGPELVLVAGAGQGLRDVVPALVRLARDNGCNSVRAHVERPGMIRLMAGCGFEAVHTVMRASCGKFE